MTTATEYIITSTHTTALEAADAAGLDLSYNRAVALRDFKRLDRNARVYWVTECGRVFYEYHCEDGVVLLNEIELGGACISSYPFSTALVSGDLIITGVTTGLPKTQKTRRRWAKSYRNHVAEYGADAPRVMLTTVD